MPKCRLCDADADRQEIRARFVYGGDSKYQFWHCEDCDAIYLYPMPSVAEEKYFYLKEFEKFMSSRSGAERDWSNAVRHKESNQDQVRRRLPFLEKYLTPNAQLLEIGCSSGFMLDAFKAYNVNCVGVEPSGEFCEYLEKCGYNVFEDISEITDIKFDLIVNFFVFEHIRDPFTFLQNAYDLLSDGGVIICEIPCANDPLTSVYDIDAFERFYWSVAHHYYYTPTSISYVLDRLGYRYEIIPEQRYDISNHMTWMMDGRPGGQGRYRELFGEELEVIYKKRLIDSWCCDTIFLYIWK